jgi:pyrroline-5-carboxylate reductase
MKVAILGFGNMGRMLAGKFKAGAVELHIANRSREKLDGFSAGNPVVCHYGDFAAAVVGAELVFLCVRPQACKEVLELAAPKMRDDAHLVSIAADVPLANLGKLFAGKVTRMMPTVTMTVDSGVTLLASNDKVREGDRAELVWLFGAYSAFRLIPEEEIEALSIVTSCGPGLLAVIFQEFERSMQRCGVRDRAAIEACLLETAAGLRGLIQLDGASLEAIYGRVATVGGTTEIGASALREGLPPLLNEMTKRMMARHAERKALIDGMWA